MCRMYIEKSYLSKIHQNFNDDVMEAINKMNNEKIIEGKIKRININEHQLIYELFSKKERILIKSFHIVDNSNICGHVDSDDYNEVIKNELLKKLIAKYPDNAMLYIVDFRSDILLDSFLSVCNLFSYIKNKLKIFKKNNFKIIATDENNTDNPINERVLWILCNKDHLELINKVAEEINTWMI